MASTRRFPLDELILRPGTYFNPHTEIMIVVDDSPEVDHEIFEAQDIDSTEWVLIAEDVPVDENRRDELIEGFQRTHQAGAAGELGEAEEGDEDEDEDEEDEDEDEDELDELEMP